MELKDQKMKSARGQSPSGLLPNEDIAWEISIERCEVVQLQYGDKGSPPKKKTVYGK